MFQIRNLSFINSLMGVMEKVSIYRGESVTISDLSVADPPIREPDHLENLYKESCKGISENEKEQLRDLLLKYQGCFSKHSEGMGLTNMAEHKIDTGNSRPPEEFHLQKFKMLTEKLMKC